MSAIAALVASAVLAGPRLSIGRLDAGRIGTGSAVYLDTRGDARLGILLESSATDCIAPVPGMGGRVACAGVPAATAAATRWWLVVPEPKDYDNVRYCGQRVGRDGCHEPIQYRSSEIASLRGRSEFAVSDVPELRGPGTHLLVVTLLLNDRTLASAPQDAPGDAAASSYTRVVVRRDDTYVGRLTELIGVPFELGPTTIPGFGHQTDRQLAADCVALVIYGRRRLGEPVPYVAPRKLRERLSVIGSAAQLVRADDAVAPLSGLRVGDVLYFGFQTAVISGGLAPGGRLQRTTSVLHTYHGVAEEVAITALPYRSARVQALRWPPSAVR